MNHAKYGTIRSTIVWHFFVVNEATTSFAFEMLGFFDGVDDVKMIKED